MISIGGRILSAVVLFLGVSILLAKLSSAPTAALFRDWFSLMTLDDSVRAHLAPVLFVPFGMLVVVFVRLTLGVHLLGPFRPILVAMGFNGAGLVPGLVVFVGVSTLILALRMHLHEEGVPYYARIATLLCAVIVLEVVAVSLGGRYGIDLLTRSIYFPFVVLCLAADGFARVLAREGLGPALWRGTTTSVVALILHLVASWPVFLDVTLRYPETLLLEIGLILVISRSLSFRWFEDRNPQRRPEPMPAAQGPDIST